MVTKAAMVVEFMMATKVGLCLCWVQDIVVSRAVGVVAKLVVCWLSTTFVVKLKRE